MAGNLSFDVTADSDASSTFLKDAAAARELGRELDRLDGRQVRVRVRLDAASQAPIQTLTKQLDSIDNRTARARVELGGAEQAEARSSAFEAVLRRLPDTVRTRIELELDGRAVERVTALATGMTKLGNVSRQVAAGVSSFRQAAGYIVDPASIPVIERVSDAIATRFHSAVDTARVGVDKLSSGLNGLKIGLVGLGVAGNVATVIANVGGAITQLSGIALLAPAAIGAVGVAYATAKLATMGFADALTGSAKKQAEAFAKMGPEAQKLVTTLKSLGPAANEFRKAIQDTAVAGLSEQVKSLASTYLPLLKTGLTEVASGMNGMAVNAAKAVQSTAAIGAVRTIIDATAQATGNMRDSVANAVLGFLNLGEAGSKYIPGIGTAIDNAAQKFREWTMVVTSTGQFDRWVQGARTGFQQLGTILGNVGSIAVTVFSTLNQNGAGLLSTLVAVTSELRTFLESAQGSAALTALAVTLAAAGNAMASVFGAALRAIAPLLTTLAPLVQQLATQIGAGLVSAINIAAPLLQRLADAMAANPELMLALAKAAAAVAIGFGPMVAIIGVAATVLKGLLLASLVGAAMTQLGLAGTAVHRVMLALVSPMALIRAALPFIAQGFGALAATLLTAMGPIGYLIIAFATLYASSEQFRAAVNGVAQTVGGLFVQALRQAGEIIATTVDLLGQIGSAVGSAVSGLLNLGAVFGPVGEAISAVLTTIFNALGNLPGAALAAFAAFVVFGKIAPIFVLASTAVAAFAARMAAFTTTSAAAAIAANTLGLAAGRVATSMAAFAARLPVIGVALIALGALVQATAIDFEGMSQKVAAGSMSFGQAVEQATQQATTGFTGFMNWLEGDAPTHEQIVKEMGAAWDTYRASLGPMEQLQADVGRAQAELNAAMASGAEGTPRAAAAAANLAQAQARLDAAHRGAAEAAKTQQQREQELADTVRSQIGAMLDYEAAVRRTADAHKAAGEALAKNGAQSTEYKAAVDEIIRAVDQQAQAAQKQAEAWGGTEAGVKAYNTELLRAADLSTTAGRDAFAKLAASLGDTELKSLSAAAAATGLRTEIMKLPDGRTVTVVVAADQGKLPEVKKQVADFAAQKYVGVVDVRASAENARGDIQQFVEFANGQRGTVQIFGDGRPAMLTVGNTKYQIDQTTGAIQVMGNVAPGEADLSGLKLKVDQTTGVMTLEMNTAPATTKTTAAVTFANGQTGTMTLEGNPTPVNGKITTAVTFANGQTGVISIDGNQTPVNGKITATVQYANGSTGTITLNPRDLVTPVVNTLKQNTSSTHTIYVQRVGETGPISGTISPVNRAGGGLVGYSGGGIATGRTPWHAARGLVLPGYSPGRDTELSWLSRGESVLVPELTRLIGGRTIMGANREMSGGRPGANTGRIASLMQGATGRTPVGQVNPVAALIASMQSRVMNAAGPRGRGSTTIVQPPNLGPLLARIGSLEKTIESAVAATRPITVQAVPGSEVEAARAVRLSLR